MRGQRETGKIQGNNYHHGNCGPSLTSKTSWVPLCTFQFLGGCQGRRTGVGVTTVSNSLILGEWVTKVLKNDDER